MRRTLFTGIGVIAALAILALVPSVSSGGPGKLVAKDVGKGESAVAVATATVKNPGKLVFVITTKPKGKKVAFRYTTDCWKDGIPYRFPTDDVGDTIRKAPWRNEMKFGVDDPDECTVTVAAKLDYKRAKKVVVKIFSM